MATKIILPRPSDIEGLDITINGIKLMVSCNICSRRWSLFFRNQDDFEQNLPHNWYVCGTCNSRKSTENHK